MRQMLAMFRVQLTQTLRDRSELLSILVLPLLLTWVFGVAFGAQGADRPVLVLWLEGDTGIYAEEIRSIADAEESLDIQDAESEDEASELLDSGEAAIAVRIPDGFSEELEAGGQVQVEIVQPPDSQRGMAAAEIVQGAIARVGANVEAARASANALEQIGGQMVPPEANYAIAPVVVPDFAELYETADSYWEPDPPVAVAGEQVRPSEVRSDNELAASNVQYSVGFTLMFVMFISFGSAQGILEEREQGTLRRLLTTPASKPIIMGGKSLGIIGVSGLEALILIGFGIVIFSVPWGDDPLAMIMLIASYVLASSGLALLVTAMVRTRSQLSAAGPVIATALAMLGGCYWPIEITPPTMQTIAKFTPTGWAMSGLLDVVSRSQGVEAALLPTGILLGMAALFFVIGLAFLRIE